MKVNLNVLYVFLISFSLIPGQTTAQEMISVGFLPQYRFEFIDQIDLSKITHLNLAFANPDSLGNLSFNDRDIVPIIEKAQKSGNKVFISLAGGALSSEWEKAWASLTTQAKRSAFISKIKTYVLENNTDGVDVDLEWSHVDENYSGFVIELADTLKSAGLEITASLPCIYRYPEISNEALAVFDWINIMAYDLTGPWAPQTVGPHSPFNFAADGISYWKDQGVGSQRLTLGLPFYGYDFGFAGVEARTYREIIRYDNDLAYQDQNGTIYYNGIPTIQAKVDLAKQNRLKGMMIWELAQDSFDQFSLLNTVWNRINGVLLAISSTKEIELTVFPNPFSNRLNFSQPLLGKFYLFNSSGIKVWQIESKSLITTIELPNLNPGAYLFVNQKDDELYTAKLVK